MDGCSEAVSSTDELGGDGVGDAAPEGGSINGVADTEQAKWDHAQVLGTLSRRARWDHNGNEAGEQDQN